MLCNTTCQKAWRGASTSRYFRISSAFPSFLDFISANIDLYVKYIIHKYRQTHSCRKQLWSVPWSFLFVFSWKHQMLLWKAFEVQCFLFQLRRFGCYDTQAAAWTCGEQNVHYFFILILCFLWGWHLVHTVHGQRPAAALMWWAAKKRFKVRQNNHQEQQSKCEPVSALMMLCLDLSRATPAQWNQRFKGDKCCFFYICAFHTTFIQFLILDFKDYFWTSTLHAIKILAMVLKSKTWLLIL